MCLAKSHTLIDKTHRVSSLHSLLLNGKTWQMLLVAKEETSTVLFTVSQVGFRSVLQHPVTTSHQPQASAFYALPNTHSALDSTSQ